MSAPCIWLVRGEHSDYSDRTDWLVRAFSSYTEAEAWVLTARARVDEVKAWLAEHDIGTYAPVTQKRAEWAGEFDAELCQVHVHAKTGARSWQIATAVQWGVRYTVVSVPFGPKVPT